MVEHQFEYLPEGIASMPPGAELASVLAAIDITCLTAADLPVVLAVSRRQLSHEQARFAAVARECALSDPDEPGQRAETMGKFAADEVRAVLCTSRTAAWTLIRRADDAEVRLPELAPSWRDGDVDEDRVRIFCTWTAQLSTEHARHVVEVVLPEAPHLTLRGLIERIREVAVGLDPDWAAKLYDNSVRQRRVRARSTEQGTANLSGLDLPLDAAARSVAHVTAMAAKAKALGHPGLVDTVRADIYLALLSPRLAGEDDDTIIAAVVAAASADDPPDPDVPDPDHAPPDNAPLDGDPSDGDPSDGDPSDGDPPDGDPPDGDPSDDAPLDDTHEPESVRRRKGPRQARIELRVGLGTLLELDDKPARLPGWGVVHAELARQLARDHVDGEWRVAVTDADGALSAALLTRHRPVSYRARPSNARLDTEYVARPTVQVHVTEEFLAGLDPARFPEWSRLIVDLQHQLQAWQQARHEDQAARGAAAGTLDPDVARRVAHRARIRAREAMARFPSAALARWIECRDQQCVFPPCGASALVSDLDHTMAVVAERGLTEAGNLGPACGHDHCLKHASGWRLHQPVPGRFVWTSPSGHTYCRRPISPVPDVPAPRPPQNPSCRLPCEYADSGPVWAADRDATTTTTSATTFTSDPRAGAPPARASPPSSSTAALPDDPPF